LLRVIYLAAGDLKRALSRWFILLTEEKPTIVESFKTDDSV